MISYESWGKYPKTSQSAYPPRWQDEQPSDWPAAASYLAFGKGRSYGDVCLNSDGLLLDTKFLNHFVDFDKEKGTLTCEAGVTLEEILELIVPEGWFLPVTPGTKHVTVAGAVANDIHGKNHHCAGTFGCHVESLGLLRSDGSRLTLSPENSNAGLFNATIAGLGLTGLILWVKFRLKKISSCLIDLETIQYDGLDEFYELSKQSDTKFEHTVAWVDMAHKNKKFGRGIFMRGNHCQSPAKTHKRSRQRPFFDVPFDIPDFVLNNFNMKLFASAFFHKQSGRCRKSLVHYEPFFYPLDAIGRWNRLYGKKGFFQYQCLLPWAAQEEALKKLYSIIQQSDVCPFLTVLKNFGEAISPGILSFPKKGPTLCMDIPNRGEKTLALFDRLDEIVRQSGGSLYPAKDARMSAKTFQMLFPKWREFAPYIDPRFSSNFWRRVTQI